jgi:hypothetical protein
MNITRSLFDAYLKCPTKCWHLSRSEPVADVNRYATWMLDKNATHAQQALHKIPGIASSDAHSLIAQPLGIGARGNWQFRIDVPIEGQGVRDCLQAVQKISSKRRAVPIEFLQIRFDFRNNLDPINKIELAFDAYLLSKLIRRDVRIVKVFHGDNYAQRAVNVSSATQRIESTLVHRSSCLISIVRIVNFSTHVAQMQ